MRRALPAAVAAVVLVLSGCAGDEAPDFIPGPGPAKIDVDTPELRTMKQDAGIEDCTPGKAGPADGGLPAVTLPCFGGGPAVELSSLRGPMVINLWASWCGPCRQEMPVLQSFQEEYGDSVPVLGIDYGDAQPVAAMELAEKSGVTYPLLADPQSELDRAAPFPGMRGLPFLALVDADGRVVHQEFVELTSKDQLVDLVNEHLGAGL